MKKLLLGLVLVTGLTSLAPVADAWPCYPRPVVYGPSYPVYPRPCYPRPYYPQPVVYPAPVYPSYPSYPSYPYPAYPVRPCPYGH